MSGCALGHIKGLRAPSFSSTLLIPRDYWIGLGGLMMNPQIIILPSLITFGVSVASGTAADTCLVMLRARSLGLIFAARLAAIWRPISVPPGKVLPALAWTA